MKRGQFWSNKLKQKDFKRLTYVLQIYKLCVVMEIKTEFWHIMVMLFNYSLVTHSVFSFWGLVRVVVLILIMYIIVYHRRVFIPHFYFICGKILYKKYICFMTLSCFFFPLFTLFYYFILFIDMHIHNFYVCIQIIWYFDCFLWVLAHFCKTCYCAHCARLARMLDPWIKIQKTEIYLIFAFDSWIFLVLAFIFLWFNV